VVQVKQLERSSHLILQASTTTAAE
jgi:hypothetical protein